MSTPRIIPDDRARLQIDGVRPGGVGLGRRQCRLGQDPRAGAARDPAAARRRRRPRKSSASPSPRRRPPTWRSACSTRSRRWTALDDASARRRDPRRSRTRKPDAGLRAQARRLFATALETPGGLKVQTIHAFCTRLLHQFPFEANVAARFEVLDEAHEAKLLDQISLDVLLEAAAEPDGAARPRACGGASPAPPTRPSRR